MIDQAARSSLSAAVQFEKSLPPVVVQISYARRAIISWVTTTLAAATGMTLTSRGIGVLRTAVLLDLGADFLVVVDFVDFLLAMMNPFLSADISRKAPADILASRA